MGFFTRKRTPDTAEELNGLDRLTKTAAMSLSRRRFLRGLPALGIGGAIGLGMHLDTKPVSAGEIWCCNTKHENVACKPGVEYGCADCGGPNQQKTVKRYYSLRCCGCSPCCVLVTESAGNCGVCAQ
jgi:hypothetical protein